MKILYDYPRDLRFRCSGCGDCCRDSNILLSAPDIERLEQLDWTGIESLAGAEAPELEDSQLKGTVVEVAAGGGRPVKRLRRKDDGACVYLGARSQCLIHEHFGAAAKPLMCRLYPFSFFPVGERVAVDCAFSCRSVSQGTGDPLEASLADWQSLIEDRGLERRATLRLKPNVAMSAQLVAEIETTLLSFLRDESLSLFDRVRAVLQFPRLATMGDPETESASQLRKAMAAGLPRQIERMPWQGQMDKTQRAVFFQWLYLALNPATVNQDLLSKQELLVEERRRVEIGNRYRFDDRLPWVDNREMPVTFEQIETVDAGLVEGASADLMASFLAAKIVGKRYLLAGEAVLTLVEAVPKFLVVYPMAIWTSRALAAERGKATVEEQDLRAALRLLDRSLGQLAAASLPRKQARACDFVMLETDFVVHARNSLLGVGQEEDQIRPENLLDGLGNSEDG